MLIQRFLFLRLFVLPHPHMQGTGRGLLGQGEEFWYVNVNIDIVRVTASLWLRSVIRHKLQMNFIQMKAVVLNLNETAFGIFPYNLNPVICGGRTVGLLHVIHPLLLGRRIGLFRIHYPRLTRAKQYTTC